MVTTLPNLSSTWTVTDGLIAAPAVAAGRALLVGQLRCSGGGDVKAGGAGGGERSVGGFELVSGRTGVRGGERKIAEGRHTRNGGFGQCATQRRPFRAGFASDGERHT